MSHPALLTAFQLNSQEQWEANVLHIEHLMAQCAAQSNHATASHRLWVLPENAFCFAGDYHALQSHYAYIVEQLKQWAKHYGVWLVGGSLPTWHEPKHRFFARTWVANPDGVMVANYDKIHLFRAQVKDGVGYYDEAATFAAGQQPVVVDTPFARIGLMICFDVRFPQLALQLRAQQADILCVPSAFTYATGQKHWQALITARALDTQCMVIGANQTGWHAQNTRQTYGGSMMVDADGQIQAELQRHEGFCQCYFDKAAQQSIRHAMPDVGF